MNILKNVTAIAVIGAFTAVIGCGKEETKTTATKTSSTTSAISGPITNPLEIRNFVFQNIKPVLAWDAKANTANTFTARICDKGTNNCATAYVFECPASGQCTVFDISMGGARLINMRLVVDTNAERTHFKFEPCNVSTFDGTGGSDFVMNATISGQTGATVRASEQTTLAGADHCQ